MAILFYVESLQKKRASDKSFCQKSNSLVMTVRSLKSCYFGGLCTYFPICQTKSNIVKYNLTFTDAVLVEI